MWIATATLPASLENDLAAGRFAELAGSGADDPATAFARGIALSNLHREREAREAFGKASSDPAFSNASNVEIGFFDLNETNGPSLVAARIATLIKAVSEKTLLAARANHLLGVAHFRLMHAGDALDALTIAQETYHACACETGEAQVLDTLGMVHQWMGDETAALVSYAHSLALKARLSDRYGSAITLGNLGRYCVMLGRPAEAAAFLGLDLQIAQEVGDTRGQARVLSDLAEIDRDGTNFAGATEKLLRALGIARQTGLKQIEFEVQLNLATTAFGTGAGSDAASHLEEARRIAGTEPSEFDKLLYGWTEAKLIAATDRPRARSLMAAAVEGFRDADIPSLEIEARLALTELLLADSKKGEAEREVLVALKRARERNLPRYRVSIGELMERLSLTEGVAEESGKAIEDKPSGTTDGYLMRERLGSGTSATVFRAFDVERAREVALKVLDLESRYSKLERDRILDSARLDMEAANRARHPGLVKIFAIGRDKRGNEYLAIEYLTGGSLRDRLDGKPARDPKFVFSTLADVADALAALHAQNVVHRDLKPENIMMRSDGSPVIVDFGISHVPGVQQRKDSVSRGTPGYFSPEQAHGEPPAPADDMFSFGVIIWEWLHGGRPDASQSPVRSNWHFGGPKSPNDLMAALLDTKANSRPTADETARLLRTFAA